MFRHSIAAERESVDEGAADTGSAAIWEFLVGLVNSLSSRMRWGWNCFSVCRRRGRYDIPAPVIIIYEVIGYGRWRAGK